MATITIKTKEKKEVKTLNVSAGVRYWEDAEVNGTEDVEGNLIPCRNGDNWCPVIDIETGMITNWKSGTVADVHYKVCDDGTYELVDESGVIVKSIDGYVPEIMCPGGQGFGDYIIMKIDENGKIANWHIDLREFENTEEK